MPKGNYERVKRIKRLCFIKSHICYIPLANSDLYAICDEDRLAEVSQYNWYIHYDKNKKRIKCIQCMKDNKNILLHRLLYPEYDVIDHINRNPLDNRSCNLRECTQVENNRNMSISSRNNTGHKGVYFNNTYKKYEAGITVNKKRIYLGRFNTPEEAALAYNNAAIKYFGEFANLNSI